MSQVLRLTSMLIPVTRCPLFFVQNETGVPGLLHVKTEPADLDLEEPARRQEPVDDHI